MARVLLATENNFDEAPRPTLVIHKYFFCVNLAIINQRHIRYINPMKSQFLVVKSPLSYRFYGASPRIFYPVPDQPPVVSFGASGPVPVVSRGQPAGFPKPNVPVDGL